MNIVRLTLACLTFVLFSVCLGDAPPAPPTTGPSAPTTQVHRGNLALSIDAQGYFEPVDDFEVRIRPKGYGGELTIVSIATNGAEVKKGDTLLELDPKALNKQLAGAENELTAADAAWAKAQADAKISEQIDALSMKVQQAALKQAQDGLAWWEKVDGPHMLENNDLIVKQAQDQVNDEQDELDQLKKMYKTEELTNATADIVVKRALRQLELAKINLIMAQERSAKFKTYSFPNSKQKVLDELQGTQYATQQVEIQQAQSKVLRDTGLVSARTTHDAAVERVADLKDDLTKLTVHAPFDGTVAYGVFSGGGFQADARGLRALEKVAAQTVLITLLVPGKLRGVVDLPEAKFDDLKPGTRATLTPVAFPELRLEATCDAVPRTGATSQSGPVYAQTLTLAGTDPRLIAGNKFDLHIDTSLADHVLLVPTTAIANSTVWVKRPSGADEPCKVITGRSDGKSTEIVSGLNEGDEVLTQAKS